MSDDKIISSWELREKVVDEPVIKYYCGTQAIDNLFEGFEAGELITLSGPTKHGKTTLFQMLTSGFYKNNIFCLWFAYEVPPKQLIRRFKDLPLFYFPERLKGRIMDYFDKKISEAVKKYGTRIIFMDHLHYLLDMAQGKNMSIQIGQIIRGLKQLAIKYNIVIFLAAHTTKLMTEREPSAEDIRDSSFVGQESDAVMILWRTKGAPDESRLKLEYHRRIGLINHIIHLKYIDKELREIM